MIQRAANPLAEIDGPPAQATSHETPAIIDARLVAGWAPERLLDFMLTTALAGDSRRPVMPVLR